MTLVGTSTDCASSDMRRKVEARMVPPTPPVPAVKYENSSEFGVSPVSSLTYICVCYIYRSRRNTHGMQVIYIHIYVCYIYIYMCVIFIGLGGIHMACR